MLKACSISKSINRQAVKLLREKNISVDVWSGENSPTQNELKELLRISVPLTEKTRNLISREKVSLLKENAIFINTSRTEVTDVQALVDFADKNPNSYLGLDIDIGAYSDLLAKRRNNVIITPHIAGCTDEAIQRTFVECAKNIVNALEKRKEEKDVEVR